MRLWEGHGKNLPKPLWLRSKGLIRLQEPPFLLEAHWKAPAVRSFQRQERRKTTKMPSLKPFRLTQDTLRRFHGAMIFGNAYKLECRRNGTKRAEYSYWRKAHVVKWRLQQSRILCFWTSLPTVSEGTNPENMFSCLTLKRSERNQSSGVTEIAEGPPF